MNNKVKFLRGTSDEYAVAEKDSDTIYFTTDDGKLYIGDKGISGTGGLTIDDTLSDTSENPVQNKVVNAALNEKASKDIMTGATSSAAGKSGLVPAPAAGKQASYLRGDGTWAVPTNTDTKVTNTLNTTAKAYVTGTTSSSTNTGTQVFDTGVYLDTTAGMLTATTFKGALSGNASTSTKLASSSCTTISIATSDWSTNSDGGYICTKTLSSAMAYTNFNFDVVLSTDQAAAKLQIEAWNCVIADGNITQTTSNGSTTAFTFYAFTTKPSVALTIAVQGVS